MQISQNSLAKLLHLSREQVGELSKNKSFLLLESAKEENTEYLIRLQLLESIENIVEWSGSRTKALNWYQNDSIPAFGGSTPEDVIKSGEIQKVLHYIKHLEMGGYS